jgi:hypothetical protein
MGLFGKGKTLVEQAEDERAKVNKKSMQLASQRLDREMISERQKKAEALRRLTA